MAIGGKAVLIFGIAVVGLIWSLVTGNMEDARLCLRIIVSGIVLTALFNGGRALVSSALHKNGDN